MKASNDRKLDLAKEILLAYIANSPADHKDVDAVCEAAKKIFDTVEAMVESTEQPKEPAGFRL